MPDYNYHAFITLIKRAAADFRYTYKEQRDKEANGVRITLTSADGERVRKTTVSAHSLKQRDVERALRALFGPPEAWNERMTSFVAGIPFEPEAEVEPAYASVLSQSRRTLFGTTSVIAINQFLGPVDEALVRAVDSFIETASVEGGPAEEMGDKPHEGGEEEDAAADDVIPAVLQGPVPERSKYIIGKLRELGIAGPDDNALGATKKIIKLMNSYPAVVAKGGAFDVTTKDIYRYLDRPYYAYSQSAWTMPLGAYRLWQAVGAHAEKAGVPRPSYKELWGECRAEPPTLRLHVLARDIYENKLLPLLDREDNRHIQTFAQLNDVAGFTEMGFRTFMPNPQMAYVKKKGRLRYMSLEGIKSIESDLIPGEFLAGLTKALHCKPKDIVSLEAWFQALGDDPGEILRKSPRVTGRKFVEADLSPKAAEVMRLIREAGFTDLKALAEFLNLRVAAAKNLPKNKDFRITEDTLGQALVKLRPYVGGGYVDLIYIRIVDAVNQRLAEKGSHKEYTLDDFFEVTKPERKTEKAKVPLEAYDNLVGVLRRPSNQYLLTMFRVAWLVNSTLDDFVPLINEVDKAYTAEDANETDPIPHPKLQELAKALGCEVADIVSLDLWKRGLAVKAAEPAEFGEHKQDKGRSDEPDEFLANAARAKAERELRTARRSIVTALAARVESLWEEATRPEAPAAPPAAPAPAPSPSKPVEADFALVALEVVQAYRALRSPQTMVQLSLLERVEGIRKKETEELTTVARSLGIDDAREASDILETTKAGIVRTVFEKTKIEITAAQAVEALRIYQADLTGRSIVNQFLDIDREEAFDEEIGKNFSPQLTAANVKDSRNNLLSLMTVALQKGEARV